MTRAAEPLYSLHERVWHWIQAAALVILVLSGFAIHYPDRFGIFGSMASSLNWHSWIGFAFIGSFRCSAALPWQDWHVEPAAS